MQNTEVNQINTEGIQETTQMETTQPEIICEDSATNNNVQPLSEPTLKYMKAEFILPFTKEIFANHEEQEKIFNDAVNSIRKQIPKATRNNITVMKKQIEIREGKRLHAVCVITPPKWKKKCWSSN